MGKHAKGRPQRLSRVIEDVPGSTPGPKYCDRCGAANPPHAGSCVGCGQRLPY